MADETAVMVRESHGVSAADFMPLMSIAQAVERKGMVNQFIGQVLRESEDFGTIPGAGAKKVLLKPGAEKLCSIFGLSVTYAEDKIIEDWTGAEHGGEPLFYYSYRAQLSRGDKFMGEAIGSCNSWESKYRYRWVPVEVANQREDFASLLKRGAVIMKFEPNFALDKKQTEGQYAKPAEYWQAFEDAIKAGTAKNVTRKLGKKEYDGWEMSMDTTQYRIPNPEVADVINTCQKMAQKRALVAAVLVVTNCSDAFTQDIEDFGDAASAPMPDGFSSAKTYDAPLQEDPRNPGAAKPPADAALPPDLQAEYEKIMNNRDYFAEACERLADQMIMKAGEAGAKAYHAVGAIILKKFPKGPQKMADVKEILLMLWKELQTVEHPLGDLVS